MSLTDLERIAGWNLTAYGGAPLQHWQDRHAAATRAYEKWLTGDAAYIASQAGQQQKSIMSAQLTAQAALLGRLAPKSASYDLSLLPPQSAPIYQEAFAAAGLQQSTDASSPAPGRALLLLGAGVLAFLLLRRS